MVRQWHATERLLNLVAIAFAVLLLLMQSSQKNVQTLLAQAERVLKRWAVFKTSTVGKLRKTIAPDFDENRSLVRPFTLGLWKLELTGILCIDTASASWYNIK